MELYTLSLTSASGGDIIATADMHLLCTAQRYNKSNKSSNKFIIIYYHICTIKILW